MLKNYNSCLHAYLLSYFPLIIFHSISCLLYNSKTMRDFSMKHGTLIKHDAQESLLLLSYLWSYFPLIIFQTLSCPLYNLKTVRDISMKLGTLIKQKTGYLMHKNYISCLHILDMHVERGGGGRHQFSHRKQIIVAS